MKNYKEIPKFKSEKEERDFWADHDSAEYINWQDAIKNPILPNLKKSTRSISIRLPESLIDSLKFLANKRDIPYQSLMKNMLAEKVHQEMA